MKKCLAVLLTATLLLTAVVLPGSAADTYFSYTQDYNTSVGGNFAIRNFSVIHDDSVLSYSNTTSTDQPALAMINSSPLTIGNTYRVSFDITVANAVAVGESPRCYLTGNDSDSTNTWASNGISYNNQHKDPSGADVNFANALNSVGAKYCNLTIVAKHKYINFYIEQSSAQFTIDKVTIQEVFNCTADTSDTAAGSATVTNANEAVAAVKNSGFAKGEQAIFKATPNAGYKFNGWYDEAGLVSDKATYTVTLGTNPVNLVARFDINTDPVFTYGYEAEQTQYSCNSNLSHGYYETDSSAHSGKSALKLTKVGTGTIVSFLTPQTDEYKLQADKKYRVSFWAKVDQGSTDSLGFNAVANGWLLLDGNQKISTQVNSTEFTQYSIDITASTSNYLAIIFYAKKDSGLTTIWFDDITVTEISPAGTVAAAYDFNGTAIRAAQGEVKQALRFKTTVNKSVLADAAAAGQTVQEYGFVVFRKDFLNGKELTVNSSYAADGSTYNAIKKEAYVAGSTDIIFKENETEKTFTAALQGITEANYDKDYAVRVYVKLSDGSIIYPNLTQYMSVLTCAELAFNATTEETGVGYTDTNGTHWQESYATRQYLYNTFGQSRGWIAPVQ